MKEILPTLTAGCSLSLPKTSRAATITKTSAQNRAREQAAMSLRDIKSDENTGLRPVRSTERIFRAVTATVKGRPARISE